MGYPRDAIVYEPAFVAPDSHSVVRPDFLIVDPENNERLTVIEVKGDRLRDANDSLKQMQAYREAMAGIDIPLYLVEARPTQAGKEVFSLSYLDSNKGLIESDFSLFPTFSALKAGQIAGAKESIRRRRKSISDSFGAISWAISALLFFIVVADFTLSFWDIRLLTTERVALIGASVALLVIPFAQKFKGLGIEWGKSNTKIAQTGNNRVKCDARTSRALRGRYVSLRFI